MRTSAVHAREKRIRYKGACVLLGWKKGTILCVNQLNDCRLMLPNSVDPIMGLLCKEVLVLSLMR